MIYHVYANRSNIGDWLAAKGIQKLLPQQEIVECLCDRPFVKDTMTRLSQATEKDLIVIGGGGLFMDYFVPFWKAFKPVAERVPFCIWGLGLCDLKNEPSLPPRKLIEEIANKSMLCVVRDKISRKFLENCDIPDPIACPSLNFIEQSLDRGENLIHVNNYSTCGAAAYEAMCKFAVEFLKDTNRIYYETNNRIKPNSEEEMFKVLSHYEKSEFVLSSALHGCIIGAAMGKKVLAVSGDYKIDAFMEEIGLEDWTLDVSEVELVPQKLQELKSQILSQSKLNEIRKENINVAQKILQIYNDLM